MIDFYMKCNTGLKWVEIVNKNPIYGKSKFQEFSKKWLFFEFTKVIRKKSAMDSKN